MPVPTSLASLSETPSINSPAPTETVGTIMNQYIQQAYAFIAMLYAGAMTPTAPLNFNGQQINNVAAGALQTDVAIVGQLPSPTGTRVVLQQAAAPTGWTIDPAATFTDAAMRFNQTPSSGGATGLVASGWIGGATFNSSQTAITQAQMPSHTHGDYGHGHGAGDQGHAHSVYDPSHAHASLGSGFVTAGAANNVNNSYSGPNNAQIVNATANATTGIGIYAGYANIVVNTGYANLAPAGSNNGHGHTYTAPTIKYADCVVAIKS